jgi:sialate O-acetylesterase
MHSKFLSRLLASFALAAILAPAARADVAVNPVFSDHAVLQRDRPITVWGTSDPGEKVKIKLSTETNTSANTEASSEGKWVAVLPAVQAGGPFTMTVQGKNRIEFKDVLVGDVWVCSGQSNMEMRLDRCFEADKTIAAAKNPNIRLFTVPRTTAAEPQDKVKSNGWKECTPESVPGFSGVAYYFGRDLQKALDVPVGLIHTSWGGTPAQAWTSKEALNAAPSLKHYQEELAARIEKYDPEKAKAQHEKAMKKYEDDVAKHKEAVAKAKAEGAKAPAAPRKPVAPGAPTESPGSASVLYNGMIAPIIPYAIRGAIWYQGEANAGKAYEYRTLFTTMIEDWRAHWKQGDFPFLCVQLAPYMKIEDKPTDSGWAELREAQLLATKKLPKVGIAVITDVGEEDDIHPRKKEPAGARLALLARKLAYGQDIVAMGPLFKKMRTEGNRAVLSFDNVGAGLECKGPKLIGFTIAGPDHKFVPADAEIRGETVVVSSPAVEKPVAVRYGWANFPVVNLWNKNGIPATPFRTDDWPGITQPAERKAAKK